MTQTPTTTRYISVTETAKEIRKALKALFPAVKFSVRSNSYSGGASIDVGWTDGPSTPQVEAIVKHFEGATFDGMIDLKSSRTTEHQGQQVHFGADYVFTRRTYSVALYQRGVDEVAQHYGVEAPPVLTYTYNNEPYCDPEHPTTRQQLRGRWDFSELTYQVLEEMTA